MRYLDTSHPDFVEITNEYREAQPNFVGWAFDEYGVEAMVRRHDGSLEPMVESEYLKGSVSRRCFERLRVLVYGES